MTTPASPRRNVSGRAGRSRRQHPVAHPRQPAEDDVLLRERLYHLSRHDLDREQVPEARPSSRRSHRRAERGVRRDQRSGRPRRPARDDHPGRRLPALRQRDAPTGCNPSIVRRNGLVEGTEFRENFNAGLTIQGDNARVSASYTHHNGRYGLVVTPPCVGCPGPSDVIIEDSEIAFNNTRQLPTNDDAGGTKFSAGTGMIVRGNEVHDNYGAGLWWDGYNRNAQVYDNVIYNNRNWGIFWELSYGGAKIHHNTLTGNGIGDGTANWSANVQLLVSCSDGSIGAASRSTRTRSMAPRTPSA